MLQAGQTAPDFELSADDGETVSLSRLRGQKVVLYFYPRADTPGCTIQACELRDRIERFEGADAVVLGISPDTVADVHVFREKYALPFRLLADADHAVAELYGVWKEKTNFGRTYWGAARSTFIVDEQGRVARIFENVDPNEHAELVLEALREMDGTC
jgi:thioredoxin-dependent peroxiredoxin